MDWKQRLIEIARCRGWYSATRSSKVPYPADAEDTSSDHRICVFYSPAEMRVPAHVVIGFAEGTSIPADRIVYSSLAERVSCGTPISGHIFSREAARRFIDDMRLADETLITQLRAAVTSVDLPEEETQEDRDTADAAYDALMERVRREESSPR